MNKLFYPILKPRRPNPLIQQIKQRWKSTSNAEKALSKSQRSEVDTNVRPLGEKVKETAKSASYLGVIILGVGVTGTLFFAIFRELFSSQSPNNVYSKAVERCKEDTRVQDKLGLPIVAYGAETRRRRRQHASHVIFERDGRKCIRMNFNLKGSFHQGSAQLEMVENDSGVYEYRYLFVQVDDLLQNVIVLEDNRAKSTVASSSMPSFNLTY